MVQYFTKTFTYMICEYKNRITLFVRQFFQITKQAHKFIDSFRNQLS